MMGNPVARRYRLMIQFVSFFYYFSCFRRIRPSGDAHGRGSARVPPHPRRPRRCRGGDGRPRSAALPVLKEVGIRGPPFDLHNFLSSNAVDLETQCTQRPVLLRVCSKEDLDGREDLFGESASKMDSTQQSRQKDVTPGARHSLPSEMASVTLKQGSKVSKHFAMHMPRHITRSRQNVIKSRRSISYLIWNAVSECTCSHFQYRATSQHLTVIALHLCTRKIPLCLISLEKER